MRTSNPSSRAAAKAPPTIAIVVPCYNEEEVLPETRRRMGGLLDDLITKKQISDDSAITFVDDGSRDKTWQMIEVFTHETRRICGIKLSRNRGHQNALLAGLFTAEGDAVISIDADLQDDIEAIREMIQKFREGADIVFGVRKRRTTDTFFKRATARLFYRLMNSLGAESIPDHADYRLMSRRAIESLKQYREVNLYLRGIIPLIGFRSEIVYYDRAQRLAGESKYPLRKMISLALNAITSFSIVHHVHGVRRVRDFAARQLVGRVDTLLQPCRGARLGLDRAADVFLERDSDLEHRHHWRISRQGLRRDESAPALFHREGRKTR